MKRNIFFAVVFTLAGLLVYGQSAEDFSVIQNKDGKTLTISFYEGSVKNVVIPEKLYGLPITVIGEKAFLRKELTSVTIPNGVTRIGEAAFSHNSLTSLTIPGSVAEIEEQAFYQNQLTSVTILNGVIKIGKAAFYNNKITSVTIPNSVAEIEQDAFYGNPLISVTISGSGIKIGNRAFYGSQLTGITIGKNVSLGSVASFETSFDNFYISQGKKAGSYIKKGQIWTFGTAQEFQQILSEIQKTEQEKVAREKRDAEEQKAAELRKQQEKEENEEKERMYARGKEAVQKQQAEEALRNYERGLVETISPLKELIKLKKFNNQQYSQFIEVYDKFLQQTKGPDQQFYF